MTPKEKAAELIVNYQLKCKSLNYKQAKQCAIIAVDEILYFMDMFNLDLEMTHQHKWWQQVKIEIEHL